MNGAGDAADLPLLAIARPDIRQLKPYSHAAWLPTLERLHANELPWRVESDATAAGLNRYPEPQPPELIARLAELYGVTPDEVLAGRGSDEAIDLLVRAFCRAGQDRVMLCPPTFGMYRVAAEIQGAGIVEVPLLKARDFALDVEAVLAAWDERVKILFLCSPNNPTGRLLARADIERLCAALADRCVIAVDEAYIEFAVAAAGESTSCTALLRRFPNLVVFRTLSKAYGLAGARCGALLAHPQIVALLRRIIPPYALSALTIAAVLAGTDGPHRAQAAERIAELLRERARMADALARSPLIRRVWPSDANFLLVECDDADRVLGAARAVRLIIRDQRSQPLLAGCLRITIGTPEQNGRLLAALA